MRTAAALSLCALVAVSTVASPATLNTRFGTITLGDQEAEHERVTRAALECPEGVPSDDSCFEPKSIASLAGGSGTGGAVGAPDLGTGALEAKAHCDDADFLDHAKYGIPGEYGQSRETANKALTDCIGYLRGFFQAGVKSAGELLDANGQIIISEAEMDSSSCTFTGGLTGRAKCDAYDGLGRALHGLEDFYSHSNWIDTSDPDQEISANNPPGLNMSTLAPFLAMRNDSVDVNSIPRDFSTGCFVLNWQDGTKGAEKCLAQNRNVTHVVLNKDNGDIRQVANVSIPPELPLTMNSRTDRGKIADNYERAVEYAILEARRQWSDFRAALVAEYGAEKGGLITCALTRDQPWRSCGLMTLSGGGDRLGTNTTYIIDVANANVTGVNATSTNSTTPSNVSFVDTRTFKYTAVKAEHVNFTIASLNNTSPISLHVLLSEPTNAQAEKQNATVNNGTTTLQYMAKADAHLELVVDASGLVGNQTGQYSIRVDSSVDSAGFRRATVPLLAVLLPLLVVIL